jgi:hypothetical protein
MLRIRPVRLLHHLPVEGASVRDEIADAWLLVFPELGWGMWADGKINL